MTSIDFFGIKERIVTILKNDTTNLWWTNSDPSDKTRFRKIEAGAPSPKAIHEPPLPRCWITNDNNISTVKASAVVESNAPDGTVYEYNIKIVFVVEAKDGPKTEEDADDLQKAIIEQIQGNFDLRTPGGAESTRLADSTHVKEIRTLPGMVGDRVQGREIRLKVIARA